MGYARKDVEKTKKIAKKFVRYQEGAELYSIGLTKFQELAKEAKAVYSSMIKHRAQDKNERGLSVMEKLKLDFYYGSDNIEEDLNVSRKTASSPLKELEEIGLIDMIQQTGVANIIYVNNFVSERDQEVRNQCKPESKCKRETGVKSKPVEKVHQCKNSTGEKTTPVEKSNQCSFEPGTSGKITLVPGEKFHPSNIEIDNNINNNSINQSYQSIDKIDVMDETAAYMELIRENIDYDIVMQDYEWKHAYLITALYNAPNTISHYYSAEVNYDISI